MSVSSPTPTRIIAHLAASTLSIIASNDLGAHRHGLPVHQSECLAGRRPLSGEGERVDVAGRRKEPLLEDLPQIDRRKGRSLGVLLPHPSEHRLRAGQHLLGEAPLLAVEEPVVVDVDLGGSVREGLRHLLVGVVLWERREDLGNVGRRGRRGSARGPCHDVEATRGRQVGGGKQKRPKPIHLGNMLISHVRMCFTTYAQDQITSCPSCFPSLNCTQDYKKARL